MNGSNNFKVKGRRFHRMFMNRDHPGSQLYDTLISHLKSREKMRAHEDIWRSVCEELNWEFIASFSA